MLVLCWGVECRKHGHVCSHILSAHQFNAPGLQRNRVTELKQRIKLFGFRNHSLWYNSVETFSQNRSCEGIALSRHQLPDMRFSSPWRCSFASVPSDQWPTFAAQAWWTPQDFSYKSRVKFLKLRKILSCILVFPVFLAISWKVPDWGIPLSRYCLSSQQQQWLDIQKVVRKRWEKLGFVVWVYPLVTRLRFKDWPV